MPISLERRTALAGPADTLAWLTGEDLRTGRTTAAEVAGIRAYLDETGIDLGLVLDFVTGPLARLYVRQVADVNDVAWCPKWWYHPEGIERFAILRATRYALDDLDDLAGLSDWWLVYAEPHMESLTRFRGAFWGCSARNGHRNYYGSTHRGLPTTLPDTARPAALAVA